MALRRQVLLGEYELRTAPVELRRGDERVPLQPQPARALELLADRAGDVVTRDELKREIWGDEENVDLDQAVNFTIRKIREALDDHADEPRYIETVPRSGYRLIVPVEKRILDRRHSNGRAHASRFWLRAAAVGVLATVGVGAGWLAGSKVETPLDPVAVAARPARVAVLAFSEAGETEAAPLSPVVEEELAASLTEAYGDQLRVLRQPSEAPEMPAFEADSIDPAKDFVVTGAIMHLPEGARLSVSVREAREGVSIWSSVDVVPGDELGGWLDRTVLEVGSALGLRPPRPAIPS